MRRFDLIAIQEVRDEEICARILKDLNTEEPNKWDMKVSDPVGHKESTHRERYMFLFRKDVVSCLSTPMLLVQDENKEIFVRPPFMCYFRAGIFDFVFVTIHVVWGDTVTERRKEISRLDDVLQAILERSKDEKDIILCGDFNMPPEDLAWEIEGWQPLIKAPAKTVVGDTSLYDNLWISTEYTSKSEWKGASGVMLFDKEQYEDSMQGRRAAISQISDHRPVWGLFH